MPDGSGKLPAPKKGAGKTPENSPALREARECLQLALEAGGMGWWQWDLTTGVLTGDDRCNALLWWPSGSHASYEQFLAMLHPEDRARVEAEVARAASNAGEYESEFRVLGPNGSIRWIHAKGRSVAQGGDKPERLMGAVLDITPRKQAELPEENPNPVLIATGEGRIVYANRPARRLLRSMGCAPDGPLPTVLQEAVGRVLAMAKGCEVELACAQGRVFSFALSPSATEGWVNLYGRDITERTQTEQSLRVAHEQTETILRSITDAFFALDHQWRFSYVNAETERQLRKPAGGLLGRNIWEVFPDAEAFRCRYEHAVATGQAVHFEEFYAPLESWFEVHAYPSDDGLSVYYRNATARRQAEEALKRSELFYRQTLESIPGMVFTTRADGYCEYQSQQWVDYTGVPLSEHLGDGWNKLLHPEDQPRALAAWKAAVDGSAPYDLEYRVRRHDGQYGWFKVIGRPIRDAAGQIVRWFGVALNIEDLVQAKAAAEAANVAKSQFLAAMSHELRTPMNAIMGMTDLALKEPLPPAVDDYLHTAKEAADSLLELLNEILDFSRIEAGRFELESAPFNLVKTVEQVVKTFGVRAYEKGLELAYELSDELPGLVVGDPLRLRQVLMNLVGNAIKFTLKGEVLIQAMAEERTHEAVSLRFSVSDTGVGIAPEHWDRIFSPFTQADASTTRRFGGTGLGLAISQRLVHLMGGRIWLESQPDKGSTFHVTVRLPLAKESGEPTAAVLPDRDQFRDLPVLVVVENATSRRILLHVLRSWSMQAEEAADVPTGLAKVHEAAAAGKAYRIVLADAILPGIDGFTFVNWLKNDQRLAGSVLLMLSPTDRQRYPEQCRDLEAVCLEKPISRSALFHAIASEVGLQGPPPSREKPAALPEPGRPLRVLLAEDTPANQKLVLHVLGNRGHSVEVAQHGRDALERLQQQDFDVVLMDVQMPEMDGLAATAAIRALNDPEKARLPVIAMTAHAMKGDREKCLAAGMDCYISKPIDGDEMIEVVERMAGKGGGEGQKAESHPVAPSFRPAASEVFDLDEAVGKCYGKFSMFQEMVGCFFEEAEPLLEQMRIALNHGDAAAIANTAHRLKGTVVYLAARRAAEATLRVEQIGKSGDLAAAAQAICELERQVARLKDGLQPYWRSEKV